MVCRSHAPRSSAAGRYEVAQACRLSSWSRRPATAASCNACIEHQLHTGMPEVQANHDHCTNLMEISQDSKRRQRGVAQQLGHELARLDAKWGARGRMVSVVPPLPPRGTPASARGSTKRRGT